MISFAAAAAAAAAFGQSTAQPSNPARWQVDWGEQFCTLAAAGDPLTELNFAFRTVPGSGTTSLLLLSRERDLLPQAISTLTLQPSGDTYAVSGRTDRRRGGGWALALDPLPDAFWRVFAGSNSLQVKAADGVKAKLPLAQTVAAVRAIGECRTRILTSWGVDEGAMKALREAPTPIQLGITADDYPVEAMRAGTEGAVVVRVAVSASGRTAECAAVSSSGSELLDRTTCVLILRRSRLRPAVGADGRATAATFISRVNWEIQTD